VINTRSYGYSSSVSQYFNPVDASYTPVEGLDYELSDTPSASRRTTGTSRPRAPSGSRSAFASKKSILAIIDPGASAPGLFC